MTRYEPLSIEPRWQAYWEQRRPHEARDDHGRPGGRTLDLFPCPGAVGLHMGHPKDRLAADILARYKRMRGLNMLYPMGLDGLGLPAENDAVKTGTHLPVEAAEILEKYGADVMRCHVMFRGPLEACCPWNIRDIEGVKRFLHRAWRLYGEDRRGRAEDQDALCKVRNHTIKQVTAGLETAGFNTALARLMEYVNELGRRPTCHPEDLRTLALLVAPFAPHFAEEVWQGCLGRPDSVCLEPWPSLDEAVLLGDTVTLVVQVNGKKRGSCEIPADLDEEAALARARQEVTGYLEGRALVKEIFIPRGPLANLVVR